MGSSGKAPCRCTIYGRIVHARPLGAFLNTGTFSAGTGSVILNGANQTMSGSTTFYTLQKTVTSAATLTVAAGTTQTPPGGGGTAIDQVKAKRRPSGDHANELASWT